jgi:hypothetical protein
MELPQIMEKDMDFTVPRELTYGGQGTDSCVLNKECNSFMNSCNHAGDATPCYNAATSTKFADNMPKRTIPNGSKGKITASGTFSEIITALVCRAHGNNPYGYGG